VKIEALENTKPWTTVHEAIKPTPAWHVVQLVSICVTIALIPAGRLDYAQCALLIGVIATIEKRS
jgi:hypothetical protein